MWWQVGTTGAAVTAMAAALFALPSAATRTQPANENGVVHNPDGTITIEFRELTDLRDVNMEFYEAGIRAVILGPVTGGVVECWTKYEVTPSYRQAPRPTWSSHGGVTRNEEVPLRCDDDDQRHLIMIIKCG